MPQVTSARAVQAAAIAMADDALVAVEPARDGLPAPARRLATAAFWAAVVSLIAARVALFDPGAQRAVGYLPQASLTGTASTLPR